ncbi:hypothetical protein HO173_000838 [Letharia columbiana]|uniref:Rhodopsin domain-containing protein n=1 Tax=Letharia columbiana TaxID=112416 RepID=A0A8H6G5N1_9LECA|nr:uncharacterized protein HO173_000838 [Letharia columbiana]KAF6241044.1 hypothetical protein HO173_000838 [Letharia columbiana]
MYGVASFIVTAILFPLLGFLAVCSRFYTRIRLTPTFVGIDDWLIAFSCLLVLGQGASQIVGAVIGSLGRDNEPTVEWREANQAKINYATIIVEKVTYSCIKLSVLFFYRRIFLRQKSFRIANNILVILIALWGLVFLLLQVVLETDNETLALPRGSQEWLLLWFAITDVLGDIAVLALPYPCIRKLQMSRRFKVELSFVFLLGTLSLVFGVVRLYFVAVNFAIFFHPPKTTPKAHSEPTFWTTAEVSIGLLAACLPPLKPLLEKMGGALKRSLVSFRASRSRKSERLSSVENIAKIDGFNEVKLEAAKGTEYEMTDFDRIEVEE